MKGLRVGDDRATIAAPSCQGLRTTWPCHHSCADPRSSKLVGDGLGADSEPTSDSEQRLTLPVVLSSNGHVLISELPPIGSACYSVSIQVTGDGGSMDSEAPCQV